MKKNKLLMIVFYLLAVLLILNVYCSDSIVYADDDTEISGEYNDNISFIFDLKSGTITFSGSGDMNSTADNFMPWFNYTDKIKKIVFQEGITLINFSSLGGDNIESICIPMSATNIFMGGGVGHVKSHVYLSKNIKNIYSGGFGNYTYVEIDSENLYYSSKNGSIYSKDGTKLISYYNSDDKVVIPDGVKIICSNSLDFTEKSGPTSWYIPKSVVEIEYGATCPAYISQSLRDVYYYGTKEEWNKIKIGKGNVFDGDADEDGIFEKNEKITYHFQGENTTTEQPSTCQQPTTQTTTQQNTINSKKYINGVGTISEDEKYLIDLKKQKYFIVDKITKSQLKKGLKVADKKTGGKFKITKINKKGNKITGGTVEFVGPYNSNCKIIKVIETEKIAGIKFNITVIGANACKNNKKITNVLIGSNVNTIGASAFESCSQLKTIEFNTIVIKKICSNAFKGINSKATIKVPLSKYEDYKKRIMKAKAPKTVNIPNKKLNLDDNNMDLVMKKYTVLSVSKGKDIYSDWIRLREPETAGKRGSEGFYSETYSKKIVGSIDATIPIKQLTIKLGYTVEKSKLYTIRGSISDKLKPYESCSYYYRNHWKQYTVKCKVEEIKGRKQDVIKTYQETKVIKVPQKLTSDDYGWLYSMNKDKLKETVSKKYEKDDSL